MASASASAEWALATPQPFAALSSSKVKRRLPVSSTGITRTPGEKKASLRQRVSASARTLPFQLVRYGLWRVL